MATDPMLDLTQDYSINHFTGTGTTGPFEINFAGGYIRQQNVKAYITNEDGTYTSRTLTFTGTNTVTTDVAIPVGVVLTIYRDTPKDGPAVSFTDGAIINEPNLDTLAKQAVFTAAEMVDRFAAVSDQSAEALSTANTASADATNAVATANSASGVANTAATSAAAAQAAAEAAAADASDASAAASAAQTAAAASQAHADTALATANSAQTDATNAVSTANAASSTASTAAGQAASAVTTANAANSTANTANSTANTANTTANTAKTTADNTASQFATLQSDVESFVGDPAQYMRKDQTNLPGTTNTYDLGSAAARFRYVYGVNADFSGTVSVATPTASGHAATKGYVDTTLGSYALLTGATFTGTLAAPTINSSGHITAATGIEIGGAASGVAALNVTGGFKFSGNCAIGTTPGTDTLNVAGNIKTNVLTVTGQVTGQSGISAATFTNQGDAWFGSSLASGRYTGATNTGPNLYVTGGSASSEYTEVLIGRNCASTGTAHAGLSFINTAIAGGSGTDKRLAIISGATGGATNSGSLLFYTAKAGTLASHLTIDENGYATFTPIAASNFGFSVNGVRSKFVANSENFQAYLQYNSGTNGVYVGGDNSGFFQVSNAGGSPIFRVDTSGRAIFGSTAGFSTTYGMLSMSHPSAPSLAWECGPDNSGAYVVYRTDTTTGMYLTFANPNAGWNATSDERYKVFTSDISNALDKVQTLRTKIGYYKADADQISQSFLVAQDVQAVLPEAVDATNPDKLGLSYTAVIPLLVAAIKELKSEFDAYKASHP